jgi:hypothetical protein
LLCQAQQYSAVADGMVTSSGGRRARHVDPG